MDQIMNKENQKRLRNNRLPVFSNMLDDKIVKKQRGEKKGEGRLVHGRRGMFDCKRREVFKTMVPEHVSQGCKLQNH